MTRWLKPLSLATIVGAFMLATAMPALGHLSVGRYSHNSCPINAPASRVDPVLAIFFGNGTGVTVQNHFDNDFAWTNHDLTGQQYFVSHGACGLNSHSNANGTLTRYHVRFRKTYDADPGGWGTTAQGTPHKEKWYWQCPGNPPLPGHAVYHPSENNGVSGFDDAASVVQVVLIQAHPHAKNQTVYDPLYTQPLWQNCGAYFVNSAGFVRYMYVAPPH